MQTIRQALDPKFKNLEAKVAELKAMKTPTTENTRAQTKQSASEPDACADCQGYGGHWTDIDEYGLAYYRVWCDCPMGQQAQAFYERNRAKRETETKQRLVKRLFGEALIPEAFIDATLGDFGDSRQLVKTARDALSKRQGLFLHGSPGTGKTHLAVALLREALSAGTPGLFIEVPDLLAKIRQSFSGNGNGDAEQMTQAVCGVDFLVLDDLGAEKPTEWVREQLFRIINTRYNHCRPLVATSNLSQALLAKRIGDRTVSRLVGMCKAIKLEGEDRRVTK